MLGFVVGGIVGCEDRRVCRVERRPLGLKRRDVGQRRVVGMCLESVETVTAVDTKVVTVKRPIGAAFEATRLGTIYVAEILPGSNAEQFKEVSREVSFLCFEL